ncbi:MULTISPECIES: hypothetical protein [Methanoculleus]|jgi:hypothetical protein|uniref:Uncharacterized protein n=2 Tax=Methanoculleus TaxID=45989 RepID=A3CXY8_METMJ|nr:MULTISPECIES: hypothetical protein [Methanoculleus]ABN58238.1 hypothetical protein Memar_2315 [Methanoculleus marisnigri JR1]KDE54833.1 hypothetical protein EI28_11350 [Methanoculleus sp. MH98A]MCC7555682.1 hypothetical protein [Methanoculleus marisnigri]UYU19613.1 hypothetical protein OH143_05850 [Methanoculleus submarinus]
MVALRLLAMDDVSFRSWEGNGSGAYADIWVIIPEKNLFPEFLKHFCRASDRDLIAIPYSENFF